MASLLPQEIIRTKRDGGELTVAQIERFVAGLVDGSVAEGQAAALAMAVFFNGMTLAERVALTMAMTRSGTVLTWDDLDGPVVDKHSTGGVGDTVSLMLAPAVAACGAFVPMISGRGLGHTGGTLDKMASIPGYRVMPERDEFRRVVREVGCAVIGQTDDLAPADKRLYAIRDVTATVESIPLITASILSKKLAAGLDGLVMDVKWGNGAFMSTHDAAQALADSLVEVAVGAGLPTSALLTDMNQPLASVAGNALEVRYAIDDLTNARIEPRMREVVVALGAEMLVVAGIAADVAAGRSAIEAAYADGRAAAKFAEMVTALGGPADLVEHPERHLAAAEVVVAVDVPAGTVQAIDTRAVGLAVVTLGGGRTRPQDPIDPAVGLVDLAEVGEAVGPDRPLAIVHARTEDAAAAAAEQVRGAYDVI
ncbi:MAG: thymidine phosphorylase [Ilumatobacteraceae bacterium]|jgi:thymidine phosphorylase|nr:thymidine phosphorylase [Ilumatobacteraceae bacterium]